MKRKHAYVLSRFYCTSIYRNCIIFAVLYACITVLHSGDW